MHGIQAWVALPDGSEETRAGLRPSRRGRPADLSKTADVGAADRRQGLRRAGASEDPLADVLCALGSCGRARGWNCRAEYPERAAYVASGDVEVGRPRDCRPARCWCSRPAPAVHSGANAGHSSCCWAASRWARASSSGTSSPRRKERIEQAKADWRAGPHEAAGPGQWRIHSAAADPPPPPNPMS